MALIRDGLTTEMKYAVVSLATDFGKDTAYNGEDRGFWGMPETMPFTSETYGTRILLPIWPKRSGPNKQHE